LVTVVLTYDFGAINRQELKRRFLRGWSLLFKIKGTKGYADVAVLLTFAAEMHLWRYVYI
jgi:hypothetical protein